MTAAQTVACVAVAVLGVGLVAAVRLSPPPDLGGWAPAALPGESVLALAGRGEGVLVATARGLQQVAPDGTVVDLGVPGPVRALARHQAGTYLATDQGLLDLPADTGPAEPASDGEGAPVAVRTLLPDTAVADVQALESTSVPGPQVVLGAASGVLRLVDEAPGWERLWPPPEAPEVAVEAVLPTPAGVLFAHPDGLARLQGDGRVEVLVRDVVVVELYDDRAAGLLWAGTRGGPLLLVSEDGGDSWRPRSDGLGLNAVESVLRPSTEGTLLVGGSGLADGTGNAGVQTSTDSGRTWQIEQDRLSNTHVYDLLARDEPWRVELRLLGTTLRAPLPLPMTTTRIYSGTNGGGVSTRRPAVPVLESVAPAVPTLRVLEPLLAGLLLLVCLLPAYRYLWRGAPAPRPPPTAQTPHRDRPTDLDPT